MTEEEIGRKARQLLDWGLDDMKQSTLNSLQSARRAALENYQVAGETLAVAQGASANAQGTPDSRAGFRKLLSILALLFAVTSIVYWQNIHFQQSQMSDEPEDVDISLLL